MLLVIQGWTWDKIEFLMPRIHPTIPLELQHGDLPLRFLWRWEYAHHKTSCFFPEEMMNKWIVVAVPRFSHDLDPSRCRNQLLLGKNQPLCVAIFQRNPSFLVSWNRGTSKWMVYTYIYIIEYPSINGWSRGNPSMNGWEPRVPPFQETSWEAAARLYSCFWPRGTS